MLSAIDNGTSNQSIMTSDTGILESYILGHNFTKNYEVARPRTIGEENDDGRSSHSSVSAKSELSVATPRRTDMDLGFEPEGSASPLPAHERWKLSLHNMLEDREGIVAFKNYLASFKQERILEGWLAMKGFRQFDRPRSSGNSSAASSTTGSLTSKNSQPSEERLAQKLKLAKTIYKTYLTDNKFKFISFIKRPTKQYILTHIKSASNSKNCPELDSELFLQAQTEIEHNVESNLYKNFLASSEFMKYAAQSDSFSPKLASLSNLSQSPRNTEPSVPESTTEQSAPQPVGGSSLPPPYLPRLDEDQVWNPRSNNLARNGPSMSARMPPTSLAKTAIHRSIQENSSTGKPQHNDEMSDAFPYYTPGAPYWVPPASAIGSDQASKSSDATSDTLSYTDNSSVDGISSFSNSRAGQKRMMRNHIKKNPSNALPECVHVQRTSRMKEIPNLATTNPSAFFEDLRGRLLKVIEEQKMRSRKMSAALRNNRLPITNAVATGPSIRGDDEDMDAMLESHLNRALHSPGGRHSPVMSSINNRRPRQPQDAFYGQQKPVYPDVNIGVVPGMPQNEVPDIQTPVIPVDKNQMINAWIRTPHTQVQSKKTKAPKKGKYTGSSLESPPEGKLYVHPTGSTGLQSATNNRKLHPLAQDPTMPPCDLPDSRTIVDEVKRRLIEETDGSCNNSIPTLKSLKINDPLFVATSSSASQLPYNESTTHPTSNNPHVSANGSSDLPEVPAKDSCSESDSSSETATLSNVNNSAPLKSNSNSTTVVYYMPHEPVPYRVHISHSPLTLGQFKSSLSKKGTFKYFFKQHSVELRRPVFFEVSKDDEHLPLWEGYVLAKIEPYQT